MTDSPNRPGKNRADADVAAAHGPCVMIVDDDEDFAASLSNLLRMEGYAVLVAHDASPALALLAENTIPVALVDIRLGTGSGVDLMREMRRLRPDLICVMVTAYASLEAAIEALQAGAYDYLCKPFHSDDLLATLARCFERIELIEDRRRVGEQLNHRKRMEAIGQMTSGIAHDFNNILAVQKATLRWLQERTPEGSELTDALEDALGSLEAGRQLTARLLSFGRIGLGKTEAVDLCAELPGLVRILDRTLGETVAIDLDMDPVLHPVRLDRSGLESCLLNLALNARDAMPEGGRLSIAARNVTVAWREAAGELIPGFHVRVSLVDTGTGMAEAVRLRALEPLFTTKPSGQGSGLGLPMVDNFTRQSGGGMTITSAPAQGTRIDLYFPKVPGDVSAVSSSGSTNI